MLLIWLLAVANRESFALRYIEILSSSELKW